MKRLAAGLIAVTILSSANPAPCADHVVSRELMDQRLGEVSQQRGSDLATLRSFLSGHTARRAAAALHLTPESIAKRLSSLTNRELRDLADRAQHLEKDPRAGMSGPAKAVLITLAVVGAVFIILLIYYATCNCVL